MNNDKCGTFSECTNCNSNPVCCSYFDEINPPSLNKEELDNIKDIIGNDDFYNILDENLFTLKTNGNNCIFYNDNKCGIYDNRPLDCRLYPFDIMQIEEKYYLVLYVLSCINYDNFQNNTSSIDSLINDFAPWIESFTDERNFTKIKKKEYKIIKEIKL